MVKLFKEWWLPVFLVLTGIFVIVKDVVIISHGGNISEHCAVTKFGCL